MKFGVTVHPLDPVLKPRPIPKTVDVVGYLANSSGHVAPEPNTCFNIKYLEYTQKKRLDEEERINASKKVLNDEAIYKKYAKHAEQKTYQRILNEKISKKLKEYDENIENRRKKLTDLICKEERELSYAVVNEALRGKEERIKEKIQKMNNIKEHNESERLACVKEKRLQQYLSRCAEFRPKIANQRLRETQAAQLIQMKEKESKRKSEKEVDHLWYELKVKYCEEIDKREETDRLQRVKQNNEFKYYSELQAKEKKGKEEQMRQEMLRERERVDNIRKQIEEEEKACKELKHKKRAEFKQSFNKELKEREKMLQNIADRESQIQRAYDKLADEEIEKEQAAIKAKVTTGYNDMIQYQKFLAEMKKQRVEEERNMGRIVEETMKKIQSAENDTICKAIMAKQALQEAVLKGRAQQIEERKKQEEELQKRLKLENELSIASQEQKARLRLEYERQNILKSKQYGDDLKQQMAYKKILDQREKDNIQKILDAAVTENQMYDNIVAEVLSGNIKISETHPFRQTIKDEKCLCPKPNY